MSNAISQNKMGSMPITKLIFSMSLPMMFSMFVQALYNIIDSIFVAYICEEALTGISIAFPIQNLMISFAVGTGVGVNAVLSKKLGETDYISVNKSAMNGISLSIITYLAFLVLSIIFLPIYLRSQTTNDLIYSYALKYSEVCVYISLFIFLAVMLDRLLQSTGKTIYTMYSQLAGAITNIIFDPILIFGWGPFPAMGIYGAAIATVFGQFIHFCVSIFCNLKYNSEIKFKLSYMKLDWQIVKKIYTIGIPSILLSSITSVTTYFMNLILGKFSSTAIAVYGIYFKLNSFIFMPIFGLNNGIVPIIAYNYGSKDKERIFKTIKISLIIAILIMILGTLIFLIFPKYLLRIFKASEEMLQYGIPALRIISLSFIGAAISISLSSVFQAFGKAFYSMIISFIRQLFVLLPFAYIFSLSGNINNIWFCFPIAEFAAIILSILYMIKIKKDIISKL